MHTVVASLVTLKGQRGYPFGSEEDFAAMMTMWRMCPLLMSPQVWIDETNGNKPSNFK